MPNRYNWMSDTSPEAFAKLVELQRAIPPGQKLVMALRASGELMRLAEEDVRRLHPDADDREVFLRAAARRLGRDLMIRAYGWDPAKA
ncbi:MAG: hypothetical protein IT162_22460 [Bryobacterales bacterium]|nr:hypothetical protein [Bryobacterales bacterium]